MYSNEDFTTCPDCGTVGLFAPNLLGKVVFHHKIFSKGLDGYYTFTLDHA